MSEELLKEFDETINELKREGELEMDTRRSEIVRDLIRDWIDENQVNEQGNFQSTIPTTNQAETATGS